MSHLHRGSWCDCLQHSSAYCSQLGDCYCGEEDNYVEWGWVAASPGDHSVLVSEDARQVTFHPVYSAGTAAVRGDTPLLPNHQYYWEVQMLSDVYGTDIMVGVGTQDVKVSLSQHKFSSLLGSDEESYGLSYTGRVQHAGVARAGAARGFCKGTLVGVAVDTWRGTLRFYIDRKPQGAGFSRLRRHASALYPMLCSTAAQSAMRLTYAGSRPASLLVQAAIATLSFASPADLPPGLPALLRAHRWKRFPGEKCLTDNSAEEEDKAATTKHQHGPFPRVGDTHTHTHTRSPSSYYVHSEREFRIVVRE